MKEDKSILKIDELVWKEFIDNLKKLLQIDSVQGDARLNAPYGIKPKEALEFVVSLGKMYGFHSFIVNDAMAVIEWGDTKQDDYVAVLGHVDVVAAGSGWSYPPYNLSEANTKYFGRGILDNKGPILSNLFGMIQLKQMGVEPQQKIRVLFGSNEETGMNDVAKYLEQEKPPLYGFTPDCKFPVVYGERGVLDISISTAFNEEQLSEIQAINGEFTKSSVPDSCEIGFRDGTVVSAKGKRSPSNAPELGENAITLVAHKITESFKLEQSLQAYFAWVDRCLHNKHYGEGLNIAFEDEDSGRLILTPYSMELSKNSLTLSMSLRYPISVSSEMILDQLHKEIPENSKITINRELPSHLFDKEHPIVKELSTIFSEITGLDGTPVTTTGATYARKMPNIFAFGPSFPGQKGIAHNSDEYMDVKDLRLNFQIYLNAIYRLIMRDENHGKVDEK